MDQICRARGWLVLLALAMTCYNGMVTATTTSTECYDSFISDGKCDLYNNNADCDYDGGDCCACTCDYGNTYYWCGYNGFYCLDESADCPFYGYFYFFYNYLVYGFPISTGGSYYADDDGYFLGTVDDDYYVAEDDDDYDDYDDDDDDDYYVAEDDDDYDDYDDDDDDEDYDDDEDDDDDDDEDDDDDDDDDETSLCIDSSKSDGKCDSENNNVACDYDGGDCCECTCEDDTYTCGISGYECLNASACSSGGNDSDLDVIIGATVGSLAVLGIVIAAVVFCYCRKVRTIGLPAYKAEQVVHREPTSKDKPSAIAYPVHPSASKPPPPPYEG